MTRSTGFRRALPGIALAILAVVVTPAMATTWYVRPDGGSAAQCNGRANASLATAPNCAWASPSVALPLGNAQYGNTMPTARIGGGDTLVIASGSYRIGYAADALPDTLGESCNADSPYLCAISNIPSGLDAAHPTVITGNCAAPPELWGSERNYSIFALDGQHDVTLACMELTDHAKCIDAYGASGTDGVVACKRDAYPYGDWAGEGVIARSVHNLTLSNLRIHGLANGGILAGGLSGATLLDHVSIRANGWSGFDGDIGSGSSNRGTITIRDSAIEWNGCTEAWPDTSIVGCWAQQEGGYGDGLGTASTGGDWRIIDTRIVGNSSDGLDLLYADGSGSIFIDRVLSKWNAGNQIKTKGTVTIQNSVVDGACDYLRGAGAMIEGDLCRAAGAALSLSMNAPGQVATIRNNTVIGAGDCVINGGDGGDGSSLDASNVYQYDNNILLGAWYWRKGRNACLDWYTDAVTFAATVNYHDNIVWNVKDDRCPPGSRCQDPLLRNQDPADFDPWPLPASPAIDNASGACPGADFFAVPRPQGVACDIGAVEVRGDLIFQDGFE